MSEESIEILAQSAFSVLLGLEVTEVTYVGSFEEFKPH